MIQTKKLAYTELTPIFRAASWVEGFLNDMGGDYRLIELNDFSAVLQNKSSCPCYCAESSRDIQVCYDVEKAVGVAIKVFDDNLMASFVSCCNSSGSLCEVKIEINF